jgi:ATP-dependent helicase/nuclease subunit A
MRPEHDAHAIAQLVNYVTPDWDEKQQAQLVEKIMTLRANESWLWAYKRMAEVNVSGTIVHGGEASAVSGQIDLLIQTPDEIIVLDYKTGATIPATQADVSLNYVLQLKVYHALIAQIYPTFPVRCAIVWTHEPRVMWLDERVAATPFPDKNVMLKTGIAA